MDENICSLKYWHSVCAKTFVFASVCQLPSKSPSCSTGTLRVKYHLLAYIEQLLFFGNRALVPTCTHLHLYICIHCILLLIICALMNIKTMSVSRLCVVSVFTSGLEKHQLTLQMQIQAGCYLLVLSESQWFLLQHYSISISLHIKILKSDIF